MVTLKLAAGDSTTRTRPARPLDEPGVVGGLREDVLPRGQRPAQDLGAEGLRRLDRPQAGAVVRADDDAVGARLLDRVGHPRGGDRRVGVGERGERAREEARP